MSGTVTAILLAAGASRRMGTCKQLLSLGENTVIGRCLDALIAGGVGEIAVVVAETGNGVAAAVRDYPVTVVVNPECDGDMASSVRAGRDALAAGAAGVIVFLCDYPLVSAAAINALISAHGTSPDSIIIPCHQGRRGHPLLFSRTILDELTADLILRDLVRLAPERLHYCDVDDPGVLLDMDTPDDYSRICTMISQDEAITKGANP